MLLCIGTYTDPVYVYHKCTTVSAEKCLTVAASGSVATKLSRASMWLAVS